MENPSRNLEPSAHSSLQQDPCTPAGTVRSIIVEKGVNFERGIGVMSIAPHDLTALLEDWCRGDPSALEHLIPSVYAELHRLAHIYMVRGLEFGQDVAAS